MKDYAKAYARAVSRHTDAVREVRFWAQIQAPLMPEEREAKAAADRRYNQTHAAMVRALKLWRNNP